MRTIERSARRIAQAADVHSARVLLFALFGYFAAAVPTAVRRPLWNDELYTLHAVAGGVGGLWNFLAGGAEQTPPLTHLLTAASVALFGSSEMVVRLPALLGFSLAGVCIFEFVRFRSSALYGLIAVLILLTTRAYAFSFEARAYALVLGFGALALLSWQRVNDQRFRRLALISLGLALGLAVSSHYYAILLLVPIGLGEVARSVASRRLDPAVWATIATGLLPLALFAPLIVAASRYSAGFHSHAEWRACFDAYGWVARTRLVPPIVSDGLLGMTVLLVTLVAIAVLSLGGGRARSIPPLPVAVGWTFVAAVAIAALAVAVGAVHVRGWGIGSGVAAALSLAAYGSIRLGTTTTPSGLRIAPIPDLVAGAGFLLIPLLAVLLAMLVTEAYTHRTALAATLGFAVVAPFSLAHLERERASVTVGCIALLGILFAAASVREYAAASRAAEKQSATLNFLVAHPFPALPVVVAHPHDFLQLSYYAPPPVRRRLVYLADPVQARDRLGFDSVERGLIALRFLAHLSVYRYGDFVRSERPFLLLTTPHSSRWEWIIPALSVDPWSLRPTVSANGRTLWRAVRQ